MIAFPADLRRIIRGTSLPRIQKSAYYLKRLVVCKLVGQYKKNQADTHIVALHGTGWLTAKDLVVTAGHVIYDSTDQWGGLTSMKVFIGYHGNDASNLKSRYGKFVAVPTEWVKDLDAKYDVGFVSVPIQGSLPGPIVLLTSIP